MTPRSRPKIPIPVQVDVLFRDHWMCSLCPQPTVFPLALKVLGEMVREKGCATLPAYFHPRWRRDTAPMLDNLACVIDHVRPYSRGGEHQSDNFAVACNKCNGRKSNRDRAAFLAANPRRSVKAKYGEPTAWDGLSSVFVVLGRQMRDRLTKNELQWLTALEKKLFPVAASLVNF